MQISFSSVEYANKKKQTRRDRFLATLEEVTPWAELEAQIEPFYPKVAGRGRPPIGLKKMLRMYVAQQCFGMSDEGIEDAIYDSQAIRAFVGIDLASESAPDATTLLQFRHLLQEKELTKRTLPSPMRIWLKRVCCSKKAQSSMPPLSLHRHRPRTMPMLVILKCIRRKRAINGTSA